LSMCNDVDYVQNSIVKYSEVHSSQKDTNSAPDHDYHHLLRLLLITFPGFSMYTWRTKTRGSRAHYKNYGSSFPKATKRTYNSVRC
jgi:hypothetical protein